MNKRPEPGETQDYFFRYIELVPEGDIVDTLEETWQGTQAFLSAIAEDKAGYRYAQDKWSIREVIGHLIDSERVFVNRALRFARGDSTELPVFDEQQYIAASRYDERSLSELVEEFDLMRRSHLLLFGSFNDEELARRGVANGAEIAVGSLPWIIAGHEMHHRGVIRERYL